MWAMCGCWHCKAWELELCEWQWWPPILEMICCWQHQPRPCIITSYMGDTSCIPPGLRGLYCRCFLNPLVSDIISETYDWLITGYKLIIDLNKIKFHNFITDLYSVHDSLVYWHPAARDLGVYSGIYSPGARSRFRIPKFLGPVNITSWLWWVW